MQLIDGIFGMHFSKAELTHPVAMEMPPHGHPRRKFLITFNRDQTVGSSGMLPAYEEGGDLIKILTLTCGHTTQTLRCFWHGTPHDNPDIAPDGLLSLVQLRAVQKSYADAVEEGLEYDLIAHEVCIHTYIHTYNAYTHVHTNTCMHARMCKHTYLHAHRHACIPTYIHASSQSLQ